KIAHIQLLPMLSGVQKVTLQELMILNDNEYTKYLICKEEGELTEECKRLGIKTHVVKDLTREINAVKDIIALYKIYKFLKANDIDIVHTHSAKTGFLGRVAAKLAGIPLIVHTVHGFPFDSAKNKYIAFFYKVLEFISARFADIIICLHDGDKETCKKLLHVPESKVLVLPNGIAFTEFFRLSECDKKKARTILGIPESSLVFTMVGRLWEQKNPLLLINAAKEVINEYPSDDIIFLLIGDGFLRKEIERIAEREIYHNKIVLLGWRKDIPDILSCSDVFVLPSRWEGMPLAILEAQATGLPCIVSDIPGNNNLVKDGVNGYLFESGSVTQLKDAILRMRVIEKRHEMGINAYDYVSQKHCIHKRIDNIDNLYKKMLNKKMLNKKMKLKH
ncbi:TPA: glycosyltransferase family 4 protein, partial [Escherichia coli]|nr:glycosyltransferase family 4 protein [Escherichia coli]